MENYQPTSEIIFNKREKGKIYLGIPSGSLNAQVIRLCLKAGMIDENPGRIYEFQSLFKNIIFRILDRKEMAEEVAMGIVDAGITGKDYIQEFGDEGELEIVSDFIFSKKTNNQSRLVMVSDPNEIETIEQTKGKRLFTELPKLTRKMLGEKFGFTASDMDNINLSRGKTEQKLKTGRADVISDITETGTTIKENGFVELGTLFESNPQLIANLDSIKDKAILEVIEDFSSTLKAILNAEKCPIYSVIMNVPNKVLNKVLEIIPSSKSPTMCPLQDNAWTSITTIIPEKDFFRLAPKLSRLGVNGIIPSKAEAIYQ